MNTGTGRHWLFFPDALALPASHWRNLDFFNLYRLLLALALALFGLFIGPLAGLMPWFANIALLWAMSAVLFMSGIRARYPGFAVQISAQVLTDIVCIALLMATSAPGSAYGLSLLLLVSVAAGGLSGSGRLTMAYAALAALASLSQFSVGVLVKKFNFDVMLQAALIGFGYFAIGLLSYRTVKRSLRFEREVAEKAEELALVDRIQAAVAARSLKGVLAVDAAGRLRYANVRATTLLRLSTPVSGTPLAEWYPELADWLDGAAPEVPGLRQRDIHVRLSVAPLESDALTLVVIEDQSVFDEAAQRQKLAALGRLTASLAHEIRNPLSAIGHAAQLLGEEAASRGQARLTTIIGNNVDRLNRLVEEVLTLNRRDRVSPERLDRLSVREIVRELCELEAIPAEAIRVVDECDAVFRFDREHLRQILWNLLRNAWRAGSRAPGGLRLVTVDGGNDIRLSLIDDGPGIPADDRSRLFEPFFTTEAQGTGLGLFLARELAEANGATLAYVPGARGAQFTLTMKKELDHASDDPAGR